ncbi:MAG TPA: exodeoxyribonuclease VII large subunit, partial [Ramlibacter sp.]|nr:exodeoxyribonuclease VII large subunit [Ramlibacter sp.]
MSESAVLGAGSRRVWAVGALCRAVADALEARFNPVAVRGELTGFSRAASGHCYFSLKDGQGQLRCAMFRRSASLLDFSPRDGELVEVTGRLGVYEARGDLQLVVESMRRAGQGALFEQFLRLKAKLEAEGLFDAARKRQVPLLPRGIGIVTSLGAAALHDVVTCLRRRAPHVPVVLAPAAVQGSDAPGQLVAGLQALYGLAARGDVDLILLVRGGGSIEDLWAFNDEQLARTIVASPVPLVSGVGHETDFPIADFCADLRAPTPTAAAELAAQPRDTWLAALGLLHARLQEAA